MTGQVWRYDRPENLTLASDPSLSVAIIVCCRNGQEKLDLSVASLAAQTYPEQLIQLVIVDDGSTPGLKLPPIRPKNTKIIKFANTDEQWGKTQATNFATGKVNADVFWMHDADMVFDPQHLSEHMKWHHNDDDYLVLGWKRFVANWDYQPKSLHEKLLAGQFDTLYSESEGKDSWELLLKLTDDLRSPDLDSFRAVVGATFSIKKRTWDSIGRYNPVFKMAEDTELGWRSLMAGLRLVPERDAKSWHLGVSTVEENMSMVLEHNRPNMANYIPGLGYLRKGSPINFKVPDAEVLIDARSMSFDSFALVLKRFFSDKSIQVRFRVFGPWKALHERYDLRNDPLSSLRRIYGLHSGDTRFSFEELAGTMKLSPHQILDLIELGPTPYIYFTEGELDSQINFSGMRAFISKSGNGLEGVVDFNDHRTFVIYAPALARARRLPGSSYRNLEMTWGLHWNSVERFVFQDTRGRRYYYRLIRVGVLRVLKVRRPSDIANLSHMVKKVVSKSAKAK
ncbi:MAG TPA: glycosyltransferase family 2 protein [Candidatus Paceibacterota bacterium]|nr:glycosyltransferase family 2 protein [Candidatus Paceibacterota bacterium]